MIYYRTLSIFLFIAYVFYLFFLFDYALLMGKGDLISYMAYAERNPEDWLEYDGTLNYFSSPKFFFMVVLGRLNSLVPFNLLLFLSVTVFLIIFRSFLKTVNPSYLTLFGFFLIIMHPRVFHLFISNYRTGISLALILPLISFQTSKIKLSIMSVISTLHSSTVFLMLFVLGERILRNWLRNGTIKLLLISSFIILFSFMVQSGLIIGEPWNANALYTASTLTLFLVYISCVVIFRCKNDNRWHIFRSKNR